MGRVRAIHPPMALAAALSLTLAACAPKSAPRHVSTGRDESDLRAAFDAAADRPRLVLLLSPT